jgi:hypothetical protein
MSKRALFFVYLFFFFMYFFGFGIMGNLNSDIPYPWEKMLRPIKLSGYFLTLAIVLTAHFFVFRRFYHKRPYHNLFFAIAGLLLCYIFLRYLIEEVIFPATLGYSNYINLRSFRYYFVDNIYFGSIIIFIGFVLYLFDEMFRQQVQQARLKEKNREAELNFLRSQMEPHFLFNALNNIYSLAFEESPKTANAILKLSEVMRYVTYQRSEKVPLSKELEYVESMIDIHQLRLDHKLQVQISVDPGAQQTELMPLVLVALAENALKHGDLSDQDMPLNIKATLLPKQLKLTVSNKLKKTVAKDGGIGLQNLKRRLELSYEPGDYAFEMTEGGQTYSATLILPL